MTRIEAARLLGLSPAAPLDLADLRVAYARELRDAHPDTGRNPNPARIPQLKAARDCLLSIIEDEKNACKLCGGSGYIQGLRCSACN